MAVLVGLAMATLARTVDSSSQALWRRRDERGRSRSDLFMVSLGSPWRLFISALRSAGLLIVPLLIGSAIVYLASVLIGVGVGPSNFRAHSLPLMLGAAAAVTTAWWGPGGGSLRRGTRTVIRTLAPGEVGGQAFGAVFGLVTVAALVVSWQSGSGDIDWFPLTAAPLSLLER